MNKNIHFVISLSLIIFSIFYFFLGFLLNENSAGAGGYEGDFVHSWNNLQIYLNNNLHESLLSKEFYSNRSPLAYILHEKFNPFIGSHYGYRVSVFLITLLIPILLFFTLQLKFEKINILTLSVLSSIILFSPYVRTSGYWALEENYGIIFLLLSYIFYNLFFFKKKNNKINLFLLIFSSSLCIYFDLKLVIVPLIVFLKIITSNEIIKYKLISVFLYFIFSTPYLYLVYFWKSIFSPKTRLTHEINSSLYLDHVAYIIPILALYTFPFLFFKAKNFFIILKNFFKDRLNLIFFITFAFFTFYIFFIYKPIELSYHANIGKGYLYKIGLLLFENDVYRKIFFLFSTLSAFIILILYIEKNVNDWLIIFYLVLLSLFTYPLLQEYLDPLVFLLILLFFKTKINFNYKFVYGLYFYFFCFQIFANFYYSKSIYKIL